MYALLAPFVLALSLTAAPAQTAPPQQPAKKAKRVWTNDDLDALRGAGRGVSGGAPAGPSAAAEETGPAGEKQGQKEDPAKQIRKKLVPMRAQLAQLDAQINEVRGQLNNPFKGTNAVDLKHTSVTMRPEVVLANLEKKRAQLQQQIDGLEDEARRSGIPPGDIR